MTEPRYCKDCKWFCDAHYDRTYITPRCNVQGSDDASFMRRFICTLEGKLYEPIRMEIAPKEIGRNADAAQGQVIMPDAQRQSPAVSD